MVDFLVHVLVANTFISKPSDKTFINHKDGNKTNNNIESHYNNSNQSLSDGKLKFYFSVLFF
jgi:hypothetical protein